MLSINQVKLDKAIKTKQYMYKSRSLGIYFYLKNDLDILLKDLKTEEKLLNKIKK